MENKEKKYGGVIIKPVKEGSLNLTFKTNLASGDWTAYQPLPENQYGNYGDYMDCETEAFTHSIEAQMNHLKSIGAFSANQIAQMTALGYINTNGSFEFSVRFLAKLDGTTNEGNDNQSVYNGFVNYGLVAQSTWSWNPTMTFAEYYAQVPQNIIDQGRQIFNFISVAPLQWIIQDGNNSMTNRSAIIAQALVQAPVQISVPVCPSFQEGQSPIKTCNMTVPTHSMELFSVGSVFNVRDDYNPYNKEFNLDYPMLYCSLTTISVVPDIAPTLPVQPIKDPTNTYPSMVPETSTWWTKFWAVLKGNK